MKNIVCLISGRGSNLESLLATQAREDWVRDPGARIAAVLSNRPGVRGLEIARAAGVPALLVDHAGFASREDFEAALARAIEPHAPDLLVLAGFLRVLTPAFVRRFDGRILNIHPSLLPSFPGLATHRRALEAGVRVHGTTVHFVGAELDAGPIIAQSALRVAPGEDERALAARVLALEHELLPRCVRWVAGGLARLEGGRVVLSPRIDPRDLLRHEP